MAKTKPAIPSGVWVLGFVSMLMDISSELIHSLLPVFMVSYLGAGALALGMVEGVAEATALIAKLFSGTLSDYFGRRKILAILGYGLGALSKPLFALAGTINAVLAARFIDRIGKGTRGSPRDALIADMTPVESQGAAYGLRQSLDTVGAFIGPGLAMALMFLWSGDIRRIFWLAVIPGALAVALLTFGVHEPRIPGNRGPVRASIHWHTLKGMGTAYWLLVIIGAIFTLARFSEAFLILQARQAGLSDALTPAVFILMNIVCAITAYPAGRLADRMDRRSLLLIGISVLIVADLALAQDGSLMMSGFGIALWGLHLGIVQGLLSAMVAAVSPAGLRGTAFGFFNLASGIAMLVASTLAGLLWETMGASVTFYTGAVLSFVAAVLIWIVGKSDRGGHDFSSATVKAEAK
jgi:MFS family permease